ncbi:uncharacterized protein LOC112467627 [Temnothorax curvispinosus]|uniref:Uncharacterized protein LOC112467627 n=1 Tax=Temnothorax curvispinosus TaxID=300111 RepID=A0A6J1RBG7_9HYME|nr:uncharacterized protein LOC112467627 [Temnothorax curvispinosus]
MHAEKASLQPSDSSSSYMTPSTKHFLGTESKKTQQSGEKLSLIKRGIKRAIPSNDDENEISLKTRRIQKLFDQEVELNTLKIEHEKKMCALKEQHLKKMQKHELRAAIATAEIAELQLTITKK